MTKPTRTTRGTKETSGVASEVTETIAVPSRARQPWTVIDRPATASLVVLTGQDLGRRYIVKDDAVIGRGREAAIRLQHDQISRAHARVHRATDRQYVIEDLGSRNGTYVNGVLVTSHQLRFGDKIQLGNDIVILFTHHDPLEDRLAQQQRMEAVGQLAAGVAHDFNNLLGIVLSNLEFVGSLGDGRHLGELEVTECLADAVASARRAAEITRQLLTFARPATPVDSLVDVARLVAEAAQLSRHAVKNTIRVESHTEPVLMVRGDNSQLLQVLMNLVINARDAMPQGGTVTIRAERKEPNELGMVTPLLSVPYVVISVADTGIGMSDEVRKRAFEPFFTTKEPGKASGLGLAQVYSIVQWHAGHIDVESELAKGSTFRIYLPETAVASAGDSTEAAPAAAAGRPAVAAGTSRGRVLVVDDEVHLARAVERLLRSRGYDVLCAYNGREAVSLYKQQPEAIDLVVMDVSMPDLDGEETHRQLRAIHPDVKVVFASGFCTDEQVKRLMANGAIGFLHKPWTNDIFLATIDSALQTPKAGSQEGVS